MKNFFSFLFLLFAFNVVNAQLTLTQAVYEPVVGDVSNRKGFDSSGVIPKNTGAGQLWDFSSFIYNLSKANSTFTTTSAVPAATAFPNATIVETGGALLSNFWQSTGSQFNLVGVVTPTVTLSFTSNPATVASWPIAYPAYTHTDVMSGTAKSTTLTGTCNGTIHTQAMGTGTVILPEGHTFDNCIQTRSSQTVNISMGFGLVTATLTSMNYQYYTVGHKFPLINIDYQKATTVVFGSPSTNEDVAIFVNSAILSGMKEENAFNAAYTIYPNPVNDKLNLNLNNENSEFVSFQISNNLGQLVKYVESGKEKFIQETIDVSGLSKGIYFLKTNVGNTTSVKKIIIN